MAVVSFTAFLTGVDAERAKNPNFGDFVKFVEDCLQKNDVTTVEQLAEVTADNISYEGLGAVSAGMSSFLPDFCVCKKYVQIFQDGKHLSRKQLLLQ
jgi:hypothetical protein